MANRSYHTRRAAQFYERLPSGHSPSDMSSFYGTMGRQEAYYTNTFVVIVAINTEKPARVGFASQRVFTMRHPIVATVDEDFDAFEEELCKMFGFSDVTRMEVVFGIHGQHRLTVNEGNLLPVLRMLRDKDATLEIAVPRIDEIEDE